MKIVIADWCCGSNLENSGYVHGSEDGSTDDAFRIAREFYDKGLNVMIKRNAEHNIGTRKHPVIVSESVTVAVDTQKFQQR